MTVNTLSTLQMKSFDHLYRIDRIDSIMDLNNNGLPETIITTLGCSGIGCLGIKTFEWNAEDFVDLSPYANIFGPQEFYFKDIDQNGTEEIVLVGDSPGSLCVGFMIPWRYKTVIYTWNGNIFAESNFTFEAPKYRFQAIQDGDRETNNGRLEQALTSYQNAISNEKLEWWSQQRSEYEGALCYTSHQQITPTPPANLKEDTTERPRLAAYAYYRILLLHIVRGFDLDASTTYDILQQKFPAGNAGHPYAEMATLFWNAYQSTHNMTDACGAAIEYAAEHPEILVPLGSDYHGAQSHMYVPADVCPFR